MQYPPWNYSHTPPRQNVELSETPVAVQRLHACGIGHNIITSCTRCAAEVLGAGYHIRAGP